MYGFKLKLKLFYQLSHIRGSYSNLLFWITYNFIYNIFNKIGIMHLCIIFHCVFINMIKFMKMII